MNYYPIIAFNGLNKGEMELVKNVESILKEIGLTFKSTSPYPDERFWELNLNNQREREMYILFKDSQQNDISPTIIIDQILKDNIISEDNDAAYISTDNLIWSDSEMADEYQSNEYIDHAIPQEYFSEEYDEDIDDIEAENALLSSSQITDINISNNIKEILSNILDTIVSNKRILESINYDIMNSMYTNETFSKMNILQQLTDISTLDQKDRQMEIINTLLLYINDRDILNSTYKLL